VVKEEQDDRETRWSMLETIREYAQERFGIGGQMEGLPKRHAHFFLKFAESAGPHLFGPHQVDWLNRLYRDHGNLHAAMLWAIEHEDAELALRLGGALWNFWYKQSWLNEGRRWLKCALELPDTMTVPPSVYQNALHGASVLAWSHADFTEAERLAHLSYTLAGELGDRKAMAGAIHVLANVAVERSDFARAIALHEQNLALRRNLGDKAGIASSLNNLGRIAYYRGDAAQAIAYYKESLALQRELGDRFGVALTLNNLGGALADNLQEFDRARAMLQESLALSREPGVEYFILQFTLAQLGRVALYAGNFESAKTDLEESLALAREGRSKTGMAFALIHLAQVALRQNDPTRAVPLAREALTIQRTFDEKGGGARCLEVMAALFCAQGQAPRAATLIGAVEGLCENGGIQLPLAYLGEHDATVASSRAQLDVQAFDGARARGHAMTLAQAFDFALGTSS
jgi:tetratricopeptide (TPR) repeat protein